MKSKQLKNNMFGLFLTFSNKCLEFAPAMYLPILVENIVQDEIKKIIKENIKTNNYDYFELFTSSSKPTEGSDELLHLYKIAKNPDRKNIQNHLRQYQWLSYTKWSGQLWTEKTIKDRIKQLGTIDIDENIEELDQFYHFNKQKTKKIITKYNILKRDETKIWLAKELAYFRTYRLDVYTKVGYNILNLFEIISKKFGINREDLVCLTYQEILDLLKNNKKADKERIKQRQKNAWQMKFDKGKIDITHNNFEIREKHGSKNVVLKGICAFPGKVKGRVKIIRGVLEFNKMEKNAILVTSMTTPDFAPLMEKAKAIITDEGGITCHASIVARELHKPCLIGTKYATKMLKDGDMVVLDTDKGIVKIIRK
ncbi:hypothetical protein HYY69_07175 [Candidatus Woesearchaeota archaeon]|nr:hypothetical protein [Candidatus Woesearchaeota archaeon]